MLTFRSRSALWILRGTLVLGLMVVVGWTVFEAGGCVIGLTGPGTCAHFPDWIGDVAIFSVLAGYVLCLYVAPVLIVAGVVLEVLARRR